MTSPKEAYDARQQLKRIARGDEPDHKSAEDLTFDLFLSMAERFVCAIEGIEMNTRQKGGV